MDMRGAVEAARVARLATVDGNGRPRVVPCTFALLGDTLYTAVDHKPKSTADLARVRDIEGNPAVAVVVDEYSDDWDTLWWVRLRGEARLLHPDEADGGGGDTHDGDEGRDEYLAGIDALAAKYPQYRERRPGGTLIAIDVSDWTVWSARA